MVPTTARRVHKNVFATLIQTGQETLMTEYQHLATYFKSVVELLLGAVRNNHVLLCRLHAEAEYIALASTAQEAVWMRQLTTELGNLPETATVIYEDNQSAISMTKNPQYHGKAKHIAIKYHFICEQVSNGTVNLQYCPTEEMVADMFTKGLSRERFCKLRDMAGVIQLPDKYV